MEREVLWRMAPHIIWPLRFVLPHHKGLRPGLAPADRAVPLRPPGRAQAASSHAHARPADGRGRQAAQGRSVQAGLRIFGLLGRGCSARGAQRSGCGAARRRRADADQGGLGRTRQGRLGPDGAGPGERRAGDGSGQNRRQCRRPVGRRGAVDGAADEHAGEGADGAGLAHRGAPAVRPRPLLHLPERRQPHRLRDPLRAGLHADRHDRPRLFRRPGRRQGDARGGRLSVPGRQRLFREAGDARGRRVDLFGRAPALRRRRQRGAGRDARLRSGPRRGGRRAAAVDLRRKDHHLSAPRGARAREARGTLCPRRRKPSAAGRAALPCPAATSRSRASTPWWARSREPIRGSSASMRGGWRGPMARGRGRFSQGRHRSPGSAGTSGRR